MLDYPLEFICVFIDYYISNDRWDWLFLVEYNWTIQFYNLIGFN